MNHKLRQLLFLTFILLLFTSCDSYQIGGRLTFNGTEIDKITSVQPTFWFRNEDNGTFVTPTIKCNNSNVRIYELPPGNYGMSVNIDANAENPPMYPGDYSSWAQFKIIEGQISALDIELLKIIHLTSPQDNGAVMRYWDAECEDKIAHEIPMFLAWDSLEAGVYYDYRIEQMSCKPYKTLDAIAGGTTQDTSISVQLPPSAPNEFYQLTLTARKNGRMIGLLMTHGGSGHGWDYRFRVKSAGVGPR